MSKLGNAKVEEWASQDEAASHRPELPGGVLLRDQGYQGDEGNEGEGLDGADDPLQQGFGVRGQESVRQLASKALQPKLDGEDVDGKDANAHNLVSLPAEMFMEGSRGQEAAKETQADGRGEEAETEEETNSEPFQKVAHHQVGNSADDVDQDRKVVAGIILLGRNLTPFSPFFCRRQNLEQKLLGEGEAREMLEAGDGENQQQGIVHLAKVMVKVKEVIKVTVWVMVCTSGLLIGILNCFFALANIREITLFFRPSVLPSVRSFSISFNL